MGQLKNNATAIPGGSGMAKQDNGERPHGALGNLAPETFALKTAAIVG